MASSPRRSPLSSITSFFFSRTPSQVAATPPTPPQSWTDDPLPALKLSGYAATTGTRLLPPTLAERLREHLPARQQLEPCWTLAYSLEQHGASLGTLYQRCGVLAKAKGLGAGAWVLIVTTPSGAKFGAVVDQPIKVEKGRYVGNGECFLWREVEEGESHDAAEDSGFESDTGLDSSPGVTFDDGPELRVYRYTGANDYCLLCEAEGVSVGGGDGAAGLWLDDMLEEGHSAPCETFDNEVLSGGEKGRFEVLGVEVWRVG